MSKRVHNYQALQARKWPQYYVRCSRRVCQHRTQLTEEQLEKPPVCKCGSRKYIIDWHRMLKGTNQSKKMCDCTGMPFQPHRMGSSARVGKYEDSIAYCRFNPRST